MRRSQASLLVIGLLVGDSCVEEPSSVDPPSAVLLICGEAPRPTAAPSITYLIQGGAWVVMMPQADLEAIMVDQDRLLSWQRCATEAIVLACSRKD